MMIWHTDLLRWDFPAILLLTVFITGIAYFYHIWKIRRDIRARANGQVIWKEPYWIELGHSFFPMLLLVFVLRSFLFEPFRIPSGSMEPTLLTGDFVLVNKYTFGLRWPLFNDTFWPIHTPQRGDILVFRNPENIHIDFIKRVIGVPGDHLHYENHLLSLRGQVVLKTADGEGIFWDEQGRSIPMERWIESLPGSTPDGRPVVHPIYQRPNWPGKGADVVVPEGYYFVMGDNRDESADSRFWGFVPERYIIGKAVLVPMSWDARHYRVRWERIGTFL